MLELRVVEVEIESAFLDELLVRAFFDDVALVHNEDYVRILYGGEVDKEWMSQNCAHDRTRAYQQWL